MADSTLCSRADDLVDYLYGEASPDDQASFEAHVRACALCTRELGALKRVRKTLTEWEPPAMGLGLQALVQVTLDDHSEKVVEAFESEIRARPEVVACYAVTGDMDFLLHVLAPDLASFSDFALKALLRMPGVRGTRSSFIMQAVKTDLAWAPIPQPPARKPR